MIWNKTIHILCTKQRQSQATWWKEQGYTVQEHFNDGKLPSQGRNKILEDFYNGNEEWICICDDDVVLDTKWGNTDYFLKNSPALLQRIPQYINIVVPLNPTVIRLNNTLTQPVYQTHWRLERETFPTGKIIWHRRSKHIKQHESIPALSDSIWGFDHWLNGGCCMRLNNIVLKETSKGSTLFTNRQESYSIARTMFEKMYPGVKRNVLGHQMRWQYIREIIPKPFQRYYDIEKTFIEKQEVVKI